MNFWNAMGVEPQSQQIEPAVVDNSPIPVQGVSQRVQEWLGTKDAPESGTAQNILASRFQPEIGDITNALGASLSTGNYISPETALSNRLKQNAEAARAATEAQTGGTRPSAVMQAYQVIKQSHPEIDDMTALSIAQKGVGAGNTFQNGQVVNMSGAPQAAGNMSYATQAGKEHAEVNFAAPKGFAGDRGKAAGKTSIDNANSVMGLQNLDYSINQARSLIPKVSLTGPIAGRVGTAANEPNYANLQGALNGITLQAKELYNLGSGQGFSDADRDFLGEVIAGKYSRAETIQLALNRMEQISQTRQKFLAAQNQQFGSEFGYGWPPAGNVPSPLPDNLTKQQTKDAIFSTAPPTIGATHRWNPQTNQLEAIQ